MTAINAAVQAVMEAQAKWLDNTPLPVLNDFTNKMIAMSVHLKSGKYAIEEVGVFVDPAPPPVTAEALLLARACDVAACCLITTMLRRSGS